MCIDTIRLGVLLGSINDLNKFKTTLEDIIVEGSNQSVHLEYKDYRYIKEKKHRSYMKRLTLRSIDQNGTINKKRFLTIMYEPMEYLKSLYYFKFVSNLSEFETIGDFLDFFKCVMSNPFSLECLLDSEPTELHVKADIYDEDLNFFRKHFCHLTPNKSHIYSYVQNGKIVASTLYLNKGFYFYKKEKREYVRCEFRIKSKSKIKSQFEINQFKDLLSFSELREKFKKLMIYRVTGHCFYDFEDARELISTRWQNYFEHFYKDVTSGCVPSVIDGKEIFYNCYNYQKTKFNKSLLNGQFSTRFESHFKKIVYDLGSKFWIDFERFFKYKNNSKEYPVENNLVLTEVEVRKVIKEMFVGGEPDTQDFIYLMSKLLRDDSYDVIAVKLKVSKSTVVKIAKKNSSVLFAARINLRKLLHSQLYENEFGEYVEQINLLSKVREIKLSKIKNGELEKLPLSKILAIEESLKRDLSVNAGPELYIDYQDFGDTLAEGFENFGGKEAIIIDHGPTEIIRKKLRRRLD